MPAWVLTRSVSSSLKLPSGKICRTGQHKPRVVHIVPVRTHQEELCAFRGVVCSLEGVGDAGREVPQVALAHCRDVVPPELVHGRNLCRALKMCGIPDQTSSTLAARRHVRSGRKPTVPSRPTVSTQDTTTTKGRASAHLGGLVPMKLADSTRLQAHVHAGHCYKRTSAPKIRRPRAQQEASEPYL